ncbi:hypothetical protein HK097_005058, partial [Rhizophlyctis rosea]
MPVNMLKKEETDPELFGDVDDNTSTSGDARGVKRDADSEADDAQALGDGEDISIEGVKTTRSWLVKVPEFLAEHWEAQIRKGENIDLGELRVEGDLFRDLKNPKEEGDGPSTTNSKPNPAKRQKMMLTIPQNHATLAPNGPIPTTFHMNVTNPTPLKTYSFTTVQSTGSATSINSTIIAESSLLPDRTDPAYRQLLKSRAQTPLDTGRKIQYLSEQQGKKDIFIAPQSNARISSTKGFTFSKNDPDRIAAEREAKRERLPREELRSLIFKMFAKYEYHLFKGFQEQIPQPQQWLKEVLSEVAMQVKKGPYANFWTPKPEYKSAVLGVGSANEDSGEG